MLHLPPDNLQRDCQPQQDIAKKQITPRRAPSAILGDMERGEEVKVLGLDKALARMSK